MCLDGHFEQGQITDVEYILRGIPLNINEDFQLERITNTNESFIEEIIVVIFQLFILSFYSKRIYLEKWSNKY